MCCRGQGALLEVVVIFAANILLAARFGDFSSLFLARDIQTPLIAHPAAIFMTARSWLATEINAVLQGHG